MYIHRWPSADELSGCDMLCVRMPYSFKMMMQLRNSSGAECQVFMPVFALRGLARKS